MASREIRLKDIAPHGGDQRGAFEELSYLLFNREFSQGGVCLRREGAGGDQGLEGMLADSAGRVLVGLQAKFFVGALTSTQWSALDGSIKTALRDNSEDKLIRQIVVTLPRKLTKPQRTKWNTLVKGWQSQAKTSGYKKIKFDLWDESELTHRLLQDDNHGLALYYFQIPNFDKERCRYKTFGTIKALGERYQENLHTPTEAEDAIHLFLRTERFRKQYYEEMQSRIALRWRNIRPSDVWPILAKEKLQAAELAWGKVVSCLGDGIHLPPSFPNLKSALEEALQALLPVLEELRNAIPKEKPADPHEYRSRTPLEEAYQGLDNWAGAIHRMSMFSEKAAESEKQFLLLKGRPGTGKTQVLAEICNQYSQQGGAVLFAEGRIFTGSEAPWVQLLKWADFPGGGLRDFLQTFSVLSCHSTGQSPASIRHSAISSAGI